MLGVERLEDRLLALLLLVGLGFLVPVDALELWERVRLAPLVKVCDDGLRPLGIHLARGIDALTQPAVAEHLAQARSLRVLCTFFRQVRRDEEKASEGAKHHVARHASSIADAAGHIHANQGHVSDAGGIKTLAKGAKAVDLYDLLRIANATIDDLASARARGNGCGEVGPRIGSLVDLAEQVDHRHIVFDQGLNDPRVHGPDATFFFVTIVHQCVMEIGALGNKDARHRAANQDAFRMQAYPVALELTFVAMRSTYGPGLLGHCVSQALQDAVGNARPAIVESLAFPEGGQLDDVIPVAEFHGAFSPLSDVWVTMD